MFKYFYLTHRWDPNRYYTPIQILSGSNGYEGVLHILERFS